jgi:hypothetical protein
MSPEEQTTNIDPTKDNTINGEKGTKIFIPANAFQFADGSLPTGKIDITLKEFYSNSDFISNNLTTQSYGHLLETGGMVFISASSEGKELEISKIKSYTIAFPGRDTSNRMEPFYGNKDSSGQVSWTPAFMRGEGDPATGIDSTLIDSSLYKMNVTVCTYISSWYNNDIGSKVKYRDSTIFLFIKNNFPFDDTALANGLCIRGLMPHMDIYFNSEGKIDRVSFDKYNRSNPVAAGIRQSLTAFLKSIPAFDLGSMKHNRETGLSLSLCCHESLNWEEYNKRFKKKYSQYRDNAVKEMGADAINYSIISSSRMGWINCDRFLYDNSERTDFIVNITEASGALAFILFDDIKSIMRGDQKNGSFVFKNVPVNSKIKVVGITYKNGKPLLSKMPAVISKQPYTLTGFKEFSLNELEKQLNN